MANRWGGDAITTRLGAFAGGGLVWITSAADSRRAAKRAKRERVAVATEAIYVELEARRHDFSMAAVAVIQVLTPRGFVRCPRPRADGFGSAPGSARRVLCVARCGGLYFSDPVNKIVARIGGETTSLIGLLRANPGAELKGGDDPLKVATATLVTSLADLRDAMRADIQAP